MKTFIKLSRIIILLILIGACQGPEGPPGKDGNANVQTYIFNNPSWDNSHRSITIEMNGILTKEVIKNDVILVYIKHKAADYVSLLPATVWCQSHGVFREYSCDVIPNFLEIISFELDGSRTLYSELAPVDWVKVVIIESSNVSTYSGNSNKPSSSKQALLDKLEKDGVDINNYYDVCVYFGIEP